MVYLSSGLRNILNKTIDIQVAAYVRPHVSQITFVTSFYEFVTNVITFVTNDFCDECDWPKSGKNANHKRHKQNWEFLNRRITNVTSLFFNMWYTEYHKDNRGYISAIVQGRQCNKSILWCRHHDTNIFSPPLHYRHRTNLLQYRIVGIVLSS